MPKNSLSSRTAKAKQMLGKEQPKKIVKEKPKQVTKPVQKKRQPKIDVKVQKMLDKLERIIVDNIQDAESHSSDRYYIYKDNLKIFLELHHNRFYKIVVSRCYIKKGLFKKSKEYEEVFYWTENMEGSRYRKFWGKIEKVLKKEKNRRIKLVDKKELDTMFEAVVGE